MIIMNNLRIMYMGTPELSSEILEGLIQNGINIVAVVAQNDKPVGRKGISFFVDNCCYFVLIY